MENFCGRMTNCEEKQVFKRNKENNMNLIFIRHAEPDYTIDSLTEKGFREAEMLANRTKDWNVDEVYVSPMGRAQDTASFSLKNWDITPVTYDWLQEFYYRIDDPITGEKRIAWDFMPEYFTVQDDLHDKNRWADTKAMKSGNLGGYYNSVVEGLNGILARHGYIAKGNGLFEVEKHSDENIVFFCHLGVTFAMIGYMTQIAPPALWQGFFVPPTGVMIMGSEERDPKKAVFRMMNFGDIRHLPMQGEEISQSGYFAPIFQQ